MLNLAFRRALLGTQKQGTFGARRFASLAGFGESFTAGYLASDPAHAYIAIVAAAVAGGNLYNAGLDGTVLQDSDDAGGAPRANNGRDRFMRDVLALHQQDALVLAYGFNDARYTAAPDTFNVTQYGIQLRQVLNGVIAGGYASDHICLVAPHYTTDTGLAQPDNGFDGQSRAGFYAFVTEARAAALEYGTFYDDSYGYMLSHGGDALIGPDNIHPNDTGYAVIAAGVLAATRLNSLPAPRIASTGSSTGVIDVVITPPAGGPSVASYSTEISRLGSYAYGGTITGTSLAPQFTGLTGSYFVRCRANFADGSQSPWVFTDRDVSASLFLADSFTDASGTALTAHSGELGATWSVQPGSSGTAPKIDGAGRIYGTGTVNVMQAGGNPPSTDYYAEVDIDYLTAIGTDAVGVTVRMDAAANTCYYARWSASAGAWQMFKTLPGHRPWSSCRYPTRSAPAPAPCACLWPGPAPLLSSPCRSMAGF